MNAKDRKKQGFIFEKYVGECGFGPASIEKYLSHDGRVLIQIDKSQSHYRIFENNDAWLDWVESNIDEEYITHNFRAVAKIAARCLGYESWGYTAEYIASN